jgi:hypothetical protein
MTMKWKTLFTIFLFAALNHGGDMTVRISLQPESAVRVPIPRVDAVHDESGEALFQGGELHWLGDPGEPRIPWKRFVVLLGPEADLSTVSCHESRLTYQLLQEGWSVRPVPPIAGRDEKGEKIMPPAPGRRVIDGYDRDIYGRDAFWPEASARILGTGKLHEWKLAEIAVPLVRYNPVSGALARMKSGDIVVACAREDVRPAGAGLSGPLNRRGIERVRERAVNFEVTAAACGASGDTVGGPDPAGYTIITTTAVRDASALLNDFIAHKQSLGFDVRVVTEADFGGGQGDDAANNIRAWLQANYLEDDTLYVLLIGDPRPAAGEVPMKMCYSSVGQMYEMPTDFFYSDLSGDWDLNGDGYYGQWEDIGEGGIDRYWEVLVGRIPYYGQISDTDAILQKIIDYETEKGPALWRRNVLLPMVPLDSSTPSYQLGEQIKYNLLEPEAILSHRLYWETYGLVPPPETSPCNYAYVADTWSECPFGLVVWMTHGWSEGASWVATTGTILELNDNFPSATFQASCSNATPEATNNIAYALLKHGAIATNGATRVGWYYVGETSFTWSTSVGGLGYQYALRIVRGESCGRAWCDTRQDIGPGIWMNYATHNIYGDPSVVIMPPAPDYLVAGPGPAADNPASVRVFRLGRDDGYDHQFEAYGMMKHGVNVSSGNVNWDCHREIITGAGPGEINDPRVRGFQVDGTPLAGLDFLAYGTDHFGVNVAAADIDGDGFDEIITGAGPGAAFSPHVRAFDYDSRDAVKPVMGCSFLAYRVRSRGVNVSGGDIDGDGYDEIVTGAGPGRVFGPHVRGWNVDGSDAGAIHKVSFFAYGTKRKGVAVTCGDWDDDGHDEIGTAPGPSPALPSHVRGWNFDGHQVAPLSGFSFLAWPADQARYGTRIFGGADLDGDGRDDLAAGIGPDPAPEAGAGLKVFRYDGGQPAEWLSLQAYPSDWTHGVNVTAIGY